MRRVLVSIKLYLAVLAAFALGLAGLAAVTYEVGPGKPYLSIGAVPWESLKAGDTVLIYWRSTPYQEKWIIARQGTNTAPITVRGVLGPNGERPVIDGNGATTRAQLDFWGDTRGIIKVGGSSHPANYLPTYITIENLEVKSARPLYNFRAASGVTKTYSTNAAAIYVERGNHVTIRNCVLRDSGIGFFVSSTDGEAARDILFEGNYVYDNGSDTGAEHNIYTAAIGITFQYNRFGPLRAGCPGSNLKDRSAGQVVRYNWIEGGNRQLDMVDGADSILIRTHPMYRDTHVYGNVFLEPNGDGLPEMFRYGGDMGAASIYRKGTLYFFNNTIVSLRTDKTILFKLSTVDETCDARNNIFYTAGDGSTLFIAESLGTVNLGRNWLKEGFRNFSGTPLGRISSDGNNITGNEPGFVDLAARDFWITTNSACINHGGPPSTSVLPTHDLVREYVKHQGSAERIDNGIPDIGAFASAQGGGVNLPPQFAGIKNYSMTEDSSTNVSFVVTDLDGPEAVLVMATSSTPEVMADSGLVVTGTGTNRILSILPVANANGTATVILRAFDGVSIATNSFVVTINPMNDAPSFVITNSLVTVLEDAPLTYVSNFVSSIARGPLNESNQTISFVVKAANPLLFATRPAINNSGTISFKPAANVSGTSLVSVYAQDNGGVTGGGKNVSLTNTFQISIVSANDLPVFSGVTSKTINEDASTNMIFSVSDVDGIITNLSATSSNEALIPTASLEPVQTGTNVSLLLAPSPNANGTAIITLVATDDQGMPAAKTFSLTVRAVNDAPLFNKGTNPIVSINSGAQTMAGWAWPTSKGPANESSQAITFTLSNNNTNLFSTQPAISSSTGNLTFTPKTNVVGKANVTFVLRDSGGTTYGGVNSVTNQFTISVMRVPMRPGDIVVANDSATGTNGAVVLIRTNTGVQQKISGAVAQPYAVTRLDNGDLIVLDYDAAAEDPTLKRGAIYRIDAFTDARSTISIGGKFAEPCGVVVENDNQLLIADTEAFPDPGTGKAGAVFRVDAVTGSRVVLATNFNVLSGIAKNINGSIFVTDAGDKSVLLLDVSSGQRTVITSDGSLKMPVGLAVEPDTGDLIVADQEAKSLIRINIVTGVQSVVASGFEAPSHVAVDGNGDFIVSDGQQFPRIYRVNATTGVVSIVTQDGLLKQPKGITIIP